MKFLVGLEFKIETISKFSGVTWIEREKCDAVEKAVKMNWNRVKDVYRFVALQERLSWCIVQVVDIVEVVFQRERLQKFVTGEQAEYGQRGGKGEDQTEAFGRLKKWK